MSRLLLLLALGFGWLCSPLQAGDALARGFIAPPEDTKPWCYWYWISDHMSKDGISRDLEAMARVGIGEAMIGNIYLDDVPAGKIKVLSPEWWDLVAHTMREGERTGVRIGMFNCPGWSQSGGPWITPQTTMRYLATSETRVRGPVRFADQLPVPKEPFQDVAVLAFPAPAYDADWISVHHPQVRSEPSVPGVEKVADGDAGTWVDIPKEVGRGKHEWVVDVEVTAPFTARVVELVPGTEPFAADVKLQVPGADGALRTVKEFKADRSNMSLGVGFMPRGPVAVSIPATTATRFRFVFTGVRGSDKTQLAEIRVGAAPRLDSFVEKQLGKMHPTPLPMWSTYMWPTPAEPQESGLAVPRESVRDLSGQMSSDGRLVWDVPEGEWVVVRVGMTPTGMRNSPASPEGQGLEVDKMNRALAQQHFDAFIGELLRRVPPSERRAFRRVIADSYEMGSQNWTDGLEVSFRKRYGYDPMPWLPVLTGRLLSSADQSERFLWDLRRLVADRVATDYVGGLRAACKPHGLGLWLENYGHWGFPSEFLKYGSESDRIGGEYWVTGDLGSIECRAATSCANTYGKRIVSAESFTGGPAFQNSPGALKARGDWAFCEGVNHFVFHVYIQQPWEDKVPGVNAWFGTEFNRHNTWFDRSKTWVEYVRRSSWMLQQGMRVADVAYFIGEDAPKMTGLREPALPPGRDFDYINADVIEKSLAVRQGKLVLPHGTSYRVLVLPPWNTMRPEVLRKIRQLVRDGATVYGTPPRRSPSLQGYPRSDIEVQQMAREIWGAEAVSGEGEHACGRGRVVWGRDLEQLLVSMGVPADFESSKPMRFTHRQDGGTEIYFVANPKGEAVTTTVALRAGNRAPELWWADSGRREQPAVYDVKDGRVSLPISFGPHGSVFVVFRGKAKASPERIVAVRHEGQDWLGTVLTKAGASTTAGSAGANQFSFASWIRPEADTTLVGETNRGVVGLSEKRNEVLAAPHGDGFGGERHAGVGLAVGTNGVCVFEHGANYYAPTLVYTGALTGWTHVAVVYQDAQPQLYLNGEKVHTGIKSEHVVHSGARAGAVGGYRGRVGTFVEFARALSGDEVRELMKSTPQPALGGPAPALSLERRGRQSVATAGQNGLYTLRYADGQSQDLQVSGIPSAQILEGAWEVSFTPGWGAPEKAEFAELVDWTKRPEDGIRFYSGKAVYRKTLQWQPGTGADAPNGKAPIYLDLGEVRDVATVRLNGREIATLWLAPYRVDVAEWLRPGANVLEIEVINPWNNRVVGDLALPIEQRHTFILAATIKKDAPLLPAGLLGPVSLQSTRQYAVPDHRFK